ncbi:hypothetical protein GCM10027174_45460 [Salinifilum aidingensis]
MTEPIVRLVYERTAPPGVDAGVEPLIAVCATEEEAERIKAESAARDRYASWETHPLRGAAGRTTPLADGEIVHVVLLGGGNEPDDPERDPIGVAVYTDGEAAERRAAEERLRSGDPGYHAISLTIGWRAAP